MLVVVIAYWMVVVSEGTYLGTRSVTWLYDRTAGSYDALKDVPPGWDQERLSEPLLVRLALRTAPVLVLDLATGTARLPMALLAEPQFRGTVVGLDLSAEMLRHAWQKVGGWSPRLQLVKAPVLRAPLAGGAFDAVCMLEALEFTPHPQATLEEMVRLLAPGGTLMVTNRVGWEARLLPFRALGRQAMIAELLSLGLQDVRSEAWQTHYDLLWATKPDAPSPQSFAAKPDDTGEATHDRARPVGSAPWMTAMRCPRCDGRLAAAAADRLRCRQCGRAWGWRDGFWDLTTSARTLEADRPPGP